MCDVIDILVTSLFTFFIGLVSEMWQKLIVCLKVTHGHCLYDVWCYVKRVSDAKPYQSFPFHPLPHHHHLSVVTTGKGGGGGRGKGALMVKGRWHVLCVRNSLSQKGNNGQCGLSEEGD